MHYRTIHLICLTFCLCACTTKQKASNSNPQSPTIDYSNPRPTGKPALRRISTLEWPDIGAAWEEKDLFLQDSLDNSIGWFDAPSSKQWFPIEGVTHEQAKNSVIVLQSIYKGIAHL